MLLQWSTNKTSKKLRFFLDRRDVYAGQHHHRHPMG